MIIGEPTAEGLKEDMFSIAVFNSLDLRTMDGKVRIHLMDICHYALNLN